MPRLVRFYIRHVLIGWAIAAAFVAVLIGLDVAGLRHLVFTVSGGWIAAVLLLIANASVFGGVQFAIAVMGMAEDEGPKGGLRLPRYRSLRRIAAEASPGAEPGPERRRGPRATVWDANSREPV